MGEILAEAERHGREQHSEAEKAAADATREARAEAERLLDEARAEARGVARDRADHLAAIQAKLAARGPALLEGLENAGATRARLEALIEVLGAAADRVLEAADENDAGGEPDLVETEELPEESRNPAEEAVSDAVIVDDPVADTDDAVTAASDEVEKAEEAIETPAEDAGAGDENGASGPVAQAAGRSGGDGDGDARYGSAPYDGPLPEGAPMVRKPKRSPERDARFAALVLALQGRERDDVEEHLRSKHEVNDCGPILDEVFGRA